ncbi:MAG: hypothetical protein Q8920_09900 [Bacillota bacterium]|nr:hypothetical protein [Bacillota bacterium]
MSNEVILWGTLILPWLSLLLMPKAEVKRYLPAGLLSTIFCIIVIETGIRYSWWAIHETTFPFSVIPTYAYGFFPVLPMWLLKFTYKHFVLYFSLDVIFNIVFAFVILPWFDHRGIVRFSAGLTVFIFEVIISLILYGFQMWMEGIYVHSES